MSSTRLTGPLWPKATLFICFGAPPRYGQDSLLVGLVVCSAKINTTYNLFSGALCLVLKAAGFPLPPELLYDKPLGAHSNVLREQKQFKMKKKKNHQRMINLMCILQQHIDTSAYHRWLVLCSLIQNYKASIYIWSCEDSFKFLVFFLVYFCVTPSCAQELSPGTAQGNHIWWGQFQQAFKLLQLYAMPSLLYHLSGPRFCFYPLSPMLLTTKPKRCLHIVYWMVKIGLYWYWLKFIKSIPTYHILACVPNTSGHSI